MLVSFWLGSVRSLQCGMRFMQENVSVVDIGTAVTNR
jgi:hypothetical protein